MGRFALACLAAVMAGLTAAPAAAQTAFEPAAIVNDRVITRYDIDQRARLLRVNGAPDTPELGRIALEQLIETALQLEAAERQGLAAPEEAVDQAVADFAERRGVGVAALEASLRRAGASREALEDALRADLLWRETIRSRFGGRATPTETEIDQEMALAAQGEARSYQLAEIALAFATRGEDATRRFAESLVRDLRAGADFAALARRHSASPSARQGGDVGWVPERALPPAAAAQIAGGAVGAVTDPIEVPGGLTILKVLDRRSEPVAGAEPATVRLLALSGGDADTLAERAGEAAGAAAGCDAVAELAAAIGLSVDRRAPVAADALPAGTREAVATLPEGVPSAVVETAAGPTVFLVCDRAGGPDAAARDRLRDQIRQQRLQNFAAAYMQELRADAVIEMR
jgi:peptidyl-prolyl cis-trans isomerase SurA